MAIKKATLFDPTGAGARQAVEVGSQEAQALFGKGFQLEKAFDPATKISTGFEGTGEEIVNIAGGVDEGAGADLDLEGTAGGDIVNGSGAVADKVNATQTELDRLIEEFRKQQEGIKPVPTTEEALAQVKSQTAISSDQQKAIESQVASISAEFDILIKKAEREGAVTEGTALVASGRIGRLESSQLANRFSSLQRDIERNIQFLESKKISAISQARAAATQAARTGNRNQLILANSLIDQARKANESQQALFANKVDILSKISDLQARIREEEEGAETDVIDEIKRLAESGIDMASLSDEEIADFETRGGLTKGSFEAFFSSLQEAQRAKDLGDEIKLNKSIIDILAKVPEDQKIIIGDEEFSGLKEITPNIFTINKEDRQGNVVVVGINKETGEEIFRNDLGKIGKGIKPADTGIKPVTLKFSSNDTSRLLASGLSIEEIQGIQSDLNAGATINEIIGEGSGISPEQSSSLRNILKGITATQEAKALEEEVSFTTLQIQQVVKAYAKSVGVEEAKNIINNKQINISNKLIDLTDEQVTMFLEELNTMFPTGERTFLQKILPGGK